MTSRLYSRWWKQAAVGAQTPGLFSGLIQLFQTIIFCFSRRQWLLGDHLWRCRAHGKKCFVLSSEQEIPLLSWRHHPPASEWRQPGPWASRKWFFLGKIEESGPQLESCYDLAVRNRKWQECTPWSCDYPSQLRIDDVILVSSKDQTNPEWLWTTLLRCLEKFVLK